MTGSADAAVSHLLYLHGFRSSPQSTKARMTAAWIRAHRPELHWCCPQLPPSPRAAIDLVFEQLAGWPAAGAAVIGSSLGGYYATVVAERMRCPAVVLNPAVDPARDLQKHIGETRAWHGEERFHFRAEFIDELRAMAPPVPLADPRRYLAVIAEGDELLDWREMSARYAGASIKLIAGSDHALGDYAEHLPDVIDFLGLRRAAAGG